MSQVPGGRAAEVFSAKWILFASVALNIIPTLLTPPAVMIHWSVLVAMRIIEGVGGVSKTSYFSVQSFLLYIYLTSVLTYTECIYIVEWATDFFGICPGFNSAFELFDFWYIFY